jgi:TPR repeat protein
MYEQGKGVPQNYDEALKWYKKGAEQGYASAQFNLGLAYFHGRGVPQDCVLAYAWWNTAAAQGDEVAREHRDILIKHMTTSQIEKGQKVSRQYYEKFVLPFK